jgi:Flp pilus assembly protein TadG
MGYATQTNLARRRPATRGLRSRSGNAVLDMALVLPLLIALTFGAVEYGYALYIKHSLQAAAREGTRAAIVSGATASDVQTAVDSSMSAAGFATSKYTRPPTIEYSTNGTTWSTSWGSAVAGNSIRVTVTTTWGTAGISVLPTQLGGIGTGKVLTGSTTMRKEG